MISVAALRLLAAAALISPSPSPSPSLPPQIVHVVTSDRSDETLHNTVRTTYVVTADEIARNGWRTVADALETVPGVQIENYGPAGSAAGYGIRGSSSAQVLVLVDGIPAAGSLANSVELGTFSTAGIARIEVVEGGGSTLYGTGSIGGIINIITAGDKAPPSAILRYGTFDDREFSASADGLSFDRTVAQNTYALPDAGLGFPTTRSDSDYEATSARYGIDRALGRLGISLRTSLESDNTGTIGFFPYYDPGSREQDVNGNGVLGLTLGGAQSQTTATLFGARQQIEFDGALSTETRDGLSLRDVVSQGAGRLIYGIDLSRGIARSDDGAGDVTDDPLAQSAAYVQQTWTGSRGELYAGLRGERDGALGGEFSPSLGARIDLSDELNVRINAASAFRAPNASELYFPGYGNPSLHPERAQVGDFTLNDSHLLGGTALGWFLNDTRDLIVAECVQYCDTLTDTATETPVYSPENVDVAHIAGLTLDTRTVPVHGLSATMGVTDLYLAQDETAGARLPNDPVFNVSLGLAWRGAPNGFVSEAGVSERAAGARGTVDTAAPLFDQPAAYSDLQAYLTLRVQPHLLLSLRGFNLGNERYAEVAGYPLPGRTFAVELRSR